MSRDLRNRLLRIRDTGKTNASRGRTGSNGELFLPGWDKAGFMTLKRKITLDLPFPRPSVFPGAFAILAPDFVSAGRIPLPGELVFFDLETTGLSCGAGTIAFLAAFGRFSAPGGIEITQYLLLDYPGEGDFIEGAVREFRDSPFVVSYNGKCFDSQILNNRCLLNGIKPPEFHHVDLLYPARRLWKRILPNCSQSTIEVSVLGLDREGDVSGAMAPDIWFGFLKTGNPGELLSVCDHNTRDIFGLASLFLAMAEIAADPVKSFDRFRFDEETLSLFWNKILEKRPAFFKSSGPSGDDDLYRNSLETGELLLNNAGRKGYPQAILALARSHFKKGRPGEGRSLLLHLAEDISMPDSHRAAAFKSLAIDAEWRLRDIPLALHYTESALAIPGMAPNLKNELEKRYERIEAKINGKV